MIKTHRIPDEPSRRLDRYLPALEPAFSRTAWQRVIADGLVQVNGKVARASSLVANGDLITYRLPEVPATSVVAEAIPLDIVYEDEWLAVVNKPRGMVVHPAPGHTGGTLVNALMARYGEALSSLGGVKRPGIVHRIDKDTSGLLLAAKDDRVHRKLAAMLKTHQIKRSYEALVYGRPETEEGSIEAPIGRDPKNRQRMAVVVDGKPAISHFRVLESLTKGSHLAVDLETGRTHQIRVHLAFIGNPVIGDPTYAKGRPDFGMAGQALHASQLNYTHPITGIAMAHACPLPDDFLACKELLR